jgi:hypothetical protein
MLAPVWFAPAQIKPESTAVTAAGVHGAVLGEETIRNTVKSKPAVRPASIATAPQAGRPASGAVLAESIVDAHLGRAALKAPAAMVAPATCPTA